MEYQPQHTGLASRINWPQLALTALISFIACLLALLLFRALWVQKTIPAPVDDELPLRRSRRSWSEDDDDEPVLPVKPGARRAPTASPAAEPLTATVVIPAADTAGAEG